MACSMHLRQGSAVAASICDKRSTIPSSVLSNDCCVCVRMQEPLQRTAGSLKDMKVVEGELELLAKDAWMHASRASSSNGKGAEGMPAAVEHQGSGPAPSTGLADMVGRLDTAILQAVVHVSCQTSTPPSPPYTQKRASIGSIKRWTTFLGLLRVLAVQQSSTSSCSCVTARQDAFARHRKECRCGAERQRLV